MLRIANKSYLIVPFLSNLPQPKILCIIFSDLIKNGLVLLNRRNILTYIQKPVKNVFSTKYPWSSTELSLVYS